jgi:hypothetical protein
MIVGNASDKIRLETGVSVIFLYCADSALLLTNLPPEVWTLPRSDHLKADLILTCLRHGYHLSPHCLASHDRYFNYTPVSAIIGISHFETGQIMNKNRTLKSAKYVLAAMNIAFGTAAALSIIFVSYMIASIINDRYYRAYYSSSTTLTDFLLGRGLYYILIPLAVLLAVSALTGFAVYRAHRKDMRQDPRESSVSEPLEGSATEIAYTYVRRSRARAHGTGYLILMVIIGCAYAIGMLASVYFIGDRMKTMANVRWEIAAKRILGDLNLPNASYKITPPADSNEHSCTVTFSKASEDGLLTFEMQIDISGSVMQTDGDQKICGVDMTYRTGQGFDDTAWTNAQNAIDRVMSVLSLDSDMFYYPEVAKTEVDIPFSVISGVKGEEIISSDDGVNAQFDYYGTYLTVSCEKTGT